MLERIEINPRVCAGKPVIRGTRIPVAVILDELEAGESWDSILTGHPQLQRQDVQEAIRFAKLSIEFTETRVPAGN